MKRVFKSPGKRTAFFRALMRRTDKRVRATRMLRALDYQRIAAGPLASQPNERQGQG